MTDEWEPASGPQPSGFIRGPLTRLGTPPSTVRIGFWLLVASSALTIAELAIAVVHLESVDPTAPIARILALFAISAVGIALRLYVSFAVLRGYGPARTYLTLVAILTAGWTVLDGIDPMSLLVVATVIASVIAVWLPASTRYFTETSAARAAAKLTK